MTADQIAVDETTIRLHGEAFWLYDVTRTRSVPVGSRASLGDAVDPETNEILHVRLFPITTRQTTRWFQYGRLLLVQVYVSIYSNEYHGMENKNRYWDRERDEMEGEW